MARNHDRKGVGPYGLTDGPRGACYSDLVGDVPVGHDTPVWDVGEPLVDAPLKLGGSGEVEWKMEALPLPVEVLVELVEGDPERGVSLGIPVTVLNHLRCD